MRSREKRKSWMRVWINDVQEREILKKRACAAAAARMMNDFDFERSRRQSLSPSQDWPSELVQSFLFSLFFPWRWREGWESPGKYQLGWAIVLWGLYRTLKERERERRAQTTRKKYCTRNTVESDFSSSGTEERVCKGVPTSSVCWES